MTAETGLSDFHNMTLTVMKLFYKKPKKILWRIGIINTFLMKRLCLMLKIVLFIRFKTALDIALQRHAPIKKRYIRGNQAPFINKKINKEIMKRSHLRNKFLNTKSYIEREAYNKQRNLCVRLIRSEKRTSSVILIRVTSQITKPFGRR